MPARKHGRVTWERKYDTWRSRSPNAPCRYGPVVQGVHLVDRDAFEAVGVGLDGVEQADRLAVRQRHDDVGSRATWSSTASGCDATVIGRTSRFRPGIGGWSKVAVENIGGADRRPAPVRLRRSRGGGQRRAGCGYTACSPSAARVSIVEAVTATRTLREAKWLSIRSRACCSANSRVMSAQLSACSGRTRNLAVMKITVSIIWGSTNPPSAARDRPSGTDPPLRAGSPTVSDRTASRDIR